MTGGTANASLLSTGAVAAGDYIVTATGVLHGGAAKAYWSCDLRRDGVVFAATRVTVQPGLVGADEFAPFAITTGVFDPDGAAIDLACGWGSSLLGDTGPNTVDNLSLTAIRVDTLEFHNVAFP